MRRRHYCSIYEIMSYRFIGEANPLLPIGTRNGLYAAVLHHAVLLVNALQRPTSAPDMSGVSNSVLQLAGE